MPFVEVKGLKRRFGAVVAVDDISFSVNRGEVLGFLGPNGAGKSTTMKIIAGVLAPTGGAVSIDGVDVAEDAIAVKRRIGYLPEGSPLYGDMTPDGFLNFVGRARQMPSAARRRAVGEVLERLRLDAMRHRRIETLSKGYRRRVGVAQAILHDPDLLILDEPTDGLDPNQKHDVRELIKEMSADKAVIISTHILEEVDILCNRSLIIDQGRIVVDSTPQELYARSVDYNAVTVGVRADEADKTRAALTDLEAVAGVDVLRKRDGVVTLVARPRDGAFIGEAVSARLGAAGVVPVELQPTIIRLDDVFRALTGNGKRGS